MTYVFEKLYLGDIDDACNTVDLLDKKGISHILTVDCYAGQSRSATIATAYLMSRQDMTMSEALQLVKKLRPSAGPNSGFLKQLELFEAMGNHITPGNAQYRQYRLQMLASHMLNLNLQEDSLTPCLSSDPSISECTEAVYKCRKCRRSLFRESGVVTHSAGFGHSSYKKHSKTKTTTPTSHEPGISCSESIFVEPVVWMQPMILRSDGKLNCPKCHAKIGSFCWAGEQCPCGQWVTPAFHMQKSKLDYCDFRQFLNRQPVVYVAPLSPTNPDGTTKATFTSREDSNSGSTENSSTAEIDVSSMNAKDTSHYIMKPDHSL